MKFTTKQLALWLIVGAVGMLIGYFTGYQMIIGGILAVAAIAYGGYLGYLSAKKDMATEASKATAQPITTIIEDAPPSKEEVRA